MTTASPPVRWVTISTIALIACVVGLTVALLDGLAVADGYFHRSARSQHQAGAVTQIEATAIGAALGHDLASARRDQLDIELNQQLGEYRRSVVDENTAHPSSDDDERVEARDAQLLSRLALQVTAAEATATAAAIDELRVVVDRIVARERAESRRVSVAIAALRVRTMVVGVALATLASVLAVLAGAAMLTANARLQRQVGERTAELEGKNTRLADVDRSRRLFFAKLSHELRTPVTVMRGEAEVALRLDDDAAALRDVLGHVVANAGVLDRRLDELLGLARAEDGQLILEMAAFDVGAVVASAGATAAAFARSNETGLAVDIPIAGLTVVGDARWLGQAVLTVIDNAVKFSRSQVRVEATASVGQARISVADDGPGIPEAELSRVFEPWYQAAAGHAGSGAGLGLALARWIVERQGGTIAATNAATGGCVVVIELPLAA